jgi:hypothetical protein
MAWTAPRTWVAGETVTAAMMNAHLRDNLKAITDPWTAYTPTLAGTGWALGNGTLNGHYSRIGSTVQFRAQLVIGSSTAGPSASPRIGLPFHMKPSDSEGALFSAAIWDTSTALYDAFGHINTGNFNEVSIYSKILFGAVASGNVIYSAATRGPNGRIFHVRGTYETDAA